MSSRHNEKFFGRNIYQHMQKRVKNVVFVDMSKTTELFNVVKGFQKMRSERPSKNHVTTYLREMKLTFTLLPTIDLQLNIQSFGDQGLQKKVGVKP